MDANIRGWRCELCKRRCIEKGVETKKARKTRFACKCCRAFLCYPTCWHTWHDNLLSPSAAFTTPTNPKPAAQTSPPAGAKEASGAAAPTSLPKTRASPKLRKQIVKPQRPEKRLTKRRAEARARAGKTGAAQTKKATKEAAKRKKGKRGAESSKAAAMRAAKKQKGSAKASRKRPADACETESQRPRKSPRGH